MKEIVRIVKFKKVYRALKKYILVKINLKKLLGNSIDGSNIEAPEESNLLISLFNYSK